MPHTARQVRGRDTQRIGARWFQANGFPYATPIITGITGRDLENMPGCAPEFKATTKPPGPAALRQAKKQAHPDDVPFVVWRPDGFAEAQVADWPVLIVLSEFTRLLRLAGYGNPIPGTERPT